MGNAITTLVYSGDKNDIIMPKKQTIDTVFLCEQDFYNEHADMTEKIRDNMYISKKFPIVKSNIKSFIKNIYQGDENTIFRWSTWDIENADIISSDIVNNPIENQFDVICAVGCPIIHFKQEDLDAMCRLLRPDGILIFFARLRMDQKSLLQRSIDFQDFEYINIPNCVDRPFVPIARLPLENLHGRSQLSVEVWKR